MIEYKIIDLNTYARRSHLEYFMAMECPHAGLTVEVDVTDLLEFTKKEGVSFFLTFLHVVSLSADSIPQFRQRIHRLTEEELYDPKHAGAIKEGPLAGIEIREYVEGFTSHTESTGDDLYCYCDLRHHLPWAEYIKMATERQQIARKSGTLDECDDIAAAYFATCTPWFHFVGVLHPTENRYDSNPRLAWGKFEKDYRGRTMIPVNVQFHHGLIDGRQIGDFYKNIELNIAALIEGRL